MENSMIDHIRGILMLDTAALRNRLRDPARKDALRHAFNAIGHVCSIVGRVSFVHAEFCWDTKGPRNITFSTS
jgi:hypothetical protein